LSKAEKRKTIEVESIFDASKKKIDDKNKLVLVKANNNNNKDVQKESLVKKLNKSVKEKTIEMSGFGLNLNSGDKCKLDDSLSNIKSSLVILKNNKNSTQSSNNDNSSTNASTSTENKCSLVNALVSNDYGDSSNESEEGK